MKSEERRTLKTFLLAVLLAFGAPALAQQSGTLDVSQTVQKELVETSESGETTTRLVDAETVIPGERVIYTTTFRNVGSDPAANVVITNPISENLEYVDGSAFGPGMRLEFSVDGGSTFADADSLTVVNGEETRQARGSDYTHIRWTLTGELAPGAQGVVRFTAVLK